jgi:hypothetical protein
VTVGEVAVGGIGACVVIVQADSATVAERRLMARQLSPTRSVSKLMRACSSGDHGTRRGIKSPSPQQFIIIEQKRLIVIGEIYPRRI